MCGGSPADDAPLQQSEGLSPRVRGKPGPGQGPALPPRSIPACAGEAHRHHAAVNLGKVYPRVCGGSSFRISTAAVSGGLSPRVRGKRWSAPPPPPASRSIPACAGEAPDHAHDVFRYGVYPRVCGGSLKNAGVMTTDEGLSPRVRGKLGRCRHPADGFRSIPACAGEARSLAAACWPGSVYPRVCGGSAPSATRPGLIQGLSPRVRGKLAALLYVAGMGGSIPACAGEALPAKADIRRPAVYPRVCGGSSSASW